MKQVFEKHKALIVAAILLIAMIAAVLASIYLTADSTVSVPKADDLSNRANASVNQSIESVENADAFSDRVEALEAPKQQAVKKAKKSAEDFQTKKQKFEKKVKKYGELKNTPVVIGTDDLDEREHDLLSGLRELYNANR